MLSKRTLKTKKTACINFTVIAVILLIATLILKVNDAAFKTLYYIFPTALCFAYLVVLQGMFKNRFNVWSLIAMIACNVFIFCLNLLPLDVAHSKVYYELIWESILNPNTIPHKTTILLVYGAMIVIWTIQCHRLNKAIEEALW